MRSICHCQEHATGLEFNPCLSFFFPSFFLLLLIFVFHAVTSSVFTSALTPPSIPLLHHGSNSFLFVFPVLARSEFVRYLPKQLLCRVCKAFIMSPDSAGKTLTFRIFCTMWLFRFAHHSRQFDRQESGKGRLILY